MTLRDNHQGAAVLLQVAEPSFSPTQVSQGLGQPGAGEIARP